MPGGNVGAGKATGQASDAMEPPNGGNGRSKSSSVNMRDWRPAQPHNNRQDQAGGRFPRRHSPHVLVPFGDICQSRAPPMRIRIIGL